MFCVPNLHVPSHSSLRRSNIFSTPIITRPCSIDTINSFVDVYSRRWMNSSGARIRNVPMGQLNDGGTVGNIVTCLPCHQKTCFIHKTAWHMDLTCDQYELTMDPKAQASLKWITQNMKQCPKCHYRIEKNAGCDHMTCIQCQYEFC